MDNDGQLPAAVLRGIVAHIDHSPWTAAARYILATVYIQSCTCPHDHKIYYSTRGVFTGLFYLKKWLLLRKHDFIFCVLSDFIKEGNTFNPLKYFNFNIVNYNYIVYNIIIKIIIKEVAGFEKY